MCIVLHIKTIDIYNNGGNSPLCSACWSCAECLLYLQALKFAEWLALLLRLEDLHHRQMVASGFWLVIDR